MELQKIRDYLMDTFYNMCVDDGHGHDIQLEDAWMEERFVEAGLIEASASTGKKQYPKPVHEHMVLSHTEALNLDSVAASYSATLKKNDPLLNNFTRSTVDSLITMRDDEKKWTYFIEFKNGKWETDEVYRKITDSIFLLNDLEKMDRSAVLTDNRTKVKYDVQNLELSRFYEEYAGFDGTSNFYKNNAVFVLVSGKDENCFRNFAELCKRKSDYAYMNFVLEEIAFDVLKKASAGKYNFGFEYINRLAFMILNANSTNKYMIHYKNILKLFQRLESVKYPDKSNRYIIELLEKYPEIMQFLKELLYKDYRKYDNLMKIFRNLGYTEAKCFLCVAAVCSVQPAKGKRMTDDYKILCNMGDMISGLKNDDYKKYIEKLKEMVQSYSFHLKKELLEEISNENFCEINSLLKEEKWEEAVKRVLFMLRIYASHSMGDLGDVNEKIGDLISNIYGNDLIFENTSPQQLKKMLQQDSEVLMMAAAILSYLQEDIELRDEPWNDYVHMVRQLEYLRDVKSRKGNNRFGQFAAPLSEWLERNKADQMALKTLLDNIEQKIIKGKSIQEIFPMYFVQKETIEEDYQKLRNLAAKVKGKILNDVQGVKAMDFKW